jgi:hypothetical protein
VGIGHIYLFILLHAHTFVCRVYILSTNCENIKVHYKAVKIAWRVPDICFPAGCHLARHHTDIIACINLLLLLCRFVEIDHPPLFRTYGLVTYWSSLVTHSSGHSKEKGLGRKIDYRFLILESSSHCSSSHTQIHFTFINYSIC